MDLVEQNKALNHNLMGRKDRALFWQTRRLADLECLDATFFKHRYAPHIHSSYVIGIIVSGCERFFIRGAYRDAVWGELCFVNPGEVHDGAPGEDHYSYRMTYPSRDLIRDIARDLTTSPVKADPFFRDSVIRSPALARQFLEVHKNLAEWENQKDRLQSEEKMLSLYGAFLLHYSDLGGGRVIGREAGPVIRARDYIAAHYREDIDLSVLAQEAGLSRYYLIRAFAKEMGLTPHAYLISRRVEAARALLARGESPSAVAIDVGFYDQSHLARAFKQRVGVAPGQFRRLMAAS